MLGNLWKKIKGEKRKMNFPSHFPLTFLFITESLKALRLWCTSFCVNKFFSDGKMGKNNNNTIQMERKYDEKREKWKRKTMEKLLL